MLFLRSLFGALLLGSAWTTGLMAGQYVDQLDDGTVLLKLGPAYGNAVIETSRDELGPLLGGGGAPYAGTTVRLLTHDEGPNGPISGPIEALRPVWEELTGGRLELGLVPIGSSFAVDFPLRTGARLTGTPGLALHRGKKTTPIAGDAFVALPQIPPRNVTWTRAGRWVHVAKVAFEKYFLAKMRSGNTDPVYERYVLKALGIERLKQPPTATRSVS